MSTQLGHGHTFILRALDEAPHGRVVENDFNLMLALESISLPLAILNRISTLPP